MRIKHFSLWACRPVYFDSGFKLCVLQQLHAAVYCVTKEIVAMETQVLLFPPNLDK